MFPYSYPEYPFLVNPMRFSKTEALDAGYYLELVRLGRPHQLKKGPMLLLGAIHDLETMSLGMRISTTRCNQYTDIEAYRWSQALIMLIHAFNGTHCGAEYARAPLITWNERGWPNIQQWLPETLVWLDKIIAAMRSCQEGVGVEVDFRQSVHFCASWHAQCSDADDIADGRRGFAA